jgi:hypothetical protein
MANYVLHQTNFTAGEFSPFLQSRVDLQQYNSSAEIIQNMVVRHQGGLLKRPGTIFVREIKNSANDARLIPFQYSNTDAYAIEVGAGYFRFYRDGGIILSTAAITNGTFATDLTGWTDDDTGTGVSSQTAGVMRLNGGAGGVAARTQAVTYMGTAQYTLSVTGATNTCSYRIGTTLGGTEIASGTVAIGANSINFTPTTAGTVYIQFRNTANNNADVDNVSINTPVYEIQNSYLQAELDEIQFAQSYDVLYLVHNNWPPLQLTRFNHAQWTKANVAFIDGPYFSESNTTYGGTGSNITLDPAATSGSGIAVTASSALFVSTDVGRLIRYRGLSTEEYGYAQITAFTSSTSVNVNILKAFTTAPASKLWALGAWSDTTGYPGCITFFEQRMVLARSEAQQQSIWFSKAGDITNMQPDNSAYKGAVDASTAMSYTIADSQANVIAWLAPQKSLYIGSSSGVWLARSSASGEALTPDNLSIVPIINEGSSIYPPLVSRTAIIYGQRYARKLLEIGYRLEDDNYQAADLALLAEHRTSGNLKWLCTQINPNYLIWASTADGNLNGLTYVREQKVTGWHRHEIGGTDVSVKSICTIPGTDQDELWMIVSRTINGGTKQYVEYLSPYFIEQDIDDAIFVDSAISYSGSAVTTLTGLSHLEGQSVQVFGDGGQVVATSTVSSGSLTLAESVENAVVGLAYDSIVKFNPVNPPLASGAATGRRGRVYKASTQLYRSYGGQIGDDSDSLVTMPEYSSESYMDNPLTLTTGIVEHTVNSQYQFLPTLYYKHSLPVPFNIASVVSKISYAEMG